MDELTLTLIADAEPVPSVAVAHLSACAVCEARLADIRAEDRLLVAALALDSDEVRFLQAAALPQHAASTYPGTRARVLERNSVSNILPIITVCAVASLGWMAVAPVFSVWWDYARRLGLTSVLAHVIAGAFYDLIINLIVAVQAVGSLPLLEASLVVLAAVATLIWLSLIMKKGRITNQLPA